MKRLFLIMSALALWACGSKPTSEPKEAAVQSKPCDIRIEVSGKSENVKFYCFSKSPNKLVSIDKTLNFKEESISEFNLKSFTGSDFECYLKTDDSYGPEVSLKVYINNKIWVNKSDSYMPKVSGEIPLN